jgi:hypothetical protein
MTTGGTGRFEASAGVATGFCWGCLELCPKQNSMSFVGGCVKGCSTKFGADRYSWTLQSATFVLRKGGISVTGNEQPATISEVIL